MSHSSDAHSSDAHSSNIQPSTDHAPSSGMSFQLDLARARTALVEAELSRHPSERFLAAHLAALRVAAIVLARRARPGRGSSRPRNAWLVLADVAPELGEWAAFFAATEGKREAVRAGATAIISAREADDLVRDAQAFLSLVERALGRREVSREESEGSRAEGEGSRAEGGSGVQRDVTLLHRPTPRTASQQVASQQVAGARRS
jgi:hypothetical protein